MSAVQLPTRHDMIVSRWGARFLGRKIPCSIGKTGFTAAKKEGDGATPASPMRLMGGGYRADRQQRPLTQLFLKPIGPRDLWSDDPEDGAYNHNVRAPYSKSHEKLRRADPLYNVFIITDWNWPQATPGKGSAIFVHNWRKPRHPTEGCIAFAPKDLLWILSHWTPRSRLLVKDWA